MAPERKKSISSKTFLNEVDDLELVSDLSHELRTVLGGVIGINELLLTSELSPHQRQLSQTIEQSSKTLLSVLNDLVDLCRVEISEISIETAPVDINKLVADLRGQIEYLTTARNSPLKTTIQVPPLVLTDGTRLRQIIFIFVTRLLRCIENVPIELKVRTHETSDESTILHLEVSTDGIGAYDHIFLTTLNQPIQTGRKFDSRWLSLFLASRLIALLGGKCGAEINEKHCTLFAELPVTIPPGLPRA